MFYFGYALTLASATYTMQMLLRMRRWYLYILFHDTLQAVDRIFADRSTMLRAREYFLRIFYWFSRNLAVCNLNFLI